MLAPVEGEWCRFMGIDVWDWGRDEGELHSLFGAEIEESSTHRVKCEEICWQIVCSAPSPHPNKVYIISWDTADMGAHKIDWRGENSCLEYLISFLTPSSSYSQTKWSKFQN